MLFFRKFRKKTRKLLFFEKSWANLNSTLEYIVDFIFADSPYLKKFVAFYFAKTNSAKIYIFLNIYSFKVIQRS